jgi:hypothetical protein
LSVSVADLHLFLFASLLLMVGKKCFCEKIKKKKEKKRRRRTNVFAKISAGKDAHTQIRLHFSDYLYCMIDSEMCFLHEVSD